MKTLDILKLEVMEVVEKLNMSRTKVTEKNTVKLAEQYGIIKRDNKKNLKDLCDKESK